jgi:hypothetical protein
LTSIASSWNCMLNLFNNLVFSQPLQIISFMFFTWIHAWNNHAHRFGFIIDIRKSTLGFSPYSSWLLLIEQVQEWNYFLNTCLNGSYKMTLIGWSTSMQFVAIKMTHTFGNCNFIQSKNSLLLWIDQQLINQNIFWSSNKTSFYTWTLVRHEDVFNKLLSGFQIKLVIRVVCKMKIT